MLVCFIEVWHPYVTMPGLRAVANLDEAKSNNVHWTATANVSSIHIPCTPYSTCCKVFQGDLCRAQYLEWCGVVWHECGNASHECGVAWRGVA